MLEEQDRTQWDQNEIAEGCQLVEQALQFHRPGSYQIQAAIAALHAEAKTAEETDWPQIIGLYDELYRITPTPVVQLNRTVALAMAGRLDEALTITDELAELANLRDYFYLYTTRAELLRRAGRSDEARAAYETALPLAGNESERELVVYRLGRLRR